MNVLHVIPGLAATTGGPAAFVVDSSRALEGLGVRTTIFATDLSGTASSRNRSAIAPTGLPAGSEDLDIKLFPARFPRRFGYSPALGRALRHQAKNYDVIHIHSLYLHPQLAAWRHARANNIPYIVAPSGALDPYLRTRNRRLKRFMDRLWQRRMLDGAATIHYKTTEEAELTADLALDAPAVIVPNGIDTSAFESLPPRRTFRDEFLEGHDGPVILFLGRISHKKGIDLLIRAFRILLDTAPTTRLVVAGPDDESLSRSLTKLATDLAVASAVTFVGPLTGEDKLASLSSADLWTLPSHTENFGLAAVEAMAAGLPTVLSPAVNIAADASRAGAAVVCESDPPALAQQLLGLLEDEPRRRALGEHAREFAHQYDWSIVGAQLVRMYADAAARHGEATPPRTVRAWRETRE